jgi:hypothetical protein
LCLFNRNRSLDQDRADHLFDVLDNLVPIIRENGKATEQVYGELLNQKYSDIDNTVLKNGIGIDNMTTNRQRALIMNNSNYLKSVQEKKKSKEQVSKANIATRKTKSNNYLKCYACTNDYDTKELSKCIGKWCKHKYCNNKLCVMAKGTHQDSCEKVKKNSNNKVKAKK